MILIYDKNMHKSIKRQFFSEPRESSLKWFLDDSQYFANLSLVILIKKKSVYHTKSAKTNEANWRKKHFGPIVKDLCSKSEKSYDRKYHNVRYWQERTSKMFLIKKNAETRQKFTCSYKKSARLRIWVDYPITKFSSNPMKNLITFGS